MNIQNSSTMEKFLLTCNRPEDLDIKLLPILPVKLSTGEEIIPFRREMQLEELIKGGPPATILIGLLADKITLLPTKMLHHMDILQCLMESLTFTLIMVRLIIQEMLGVRLTEKIPLLTLLLMVINSGMVLCQEEPILTLTERRQ